MLFGYLVIAAFVIVTLPWSFVTMFLKSTKTGQRIAIGVSLLAVLSLIFLPLLDVHLAQLSGMMIIQTLLDKSVIAVSGLIGSSEWYLAIVLLLAPTISMAISSFYKNGGAIGGILMLCATIWILYELSAIYLVKVGIGVYVYALCAVFTCFTPLFNEKE